MEQLRRKFIGLDVGEVRIGLAASDAGGRLATPLEIVDRQEGGAVEVVVERAQSLEATAIIVGMPLQTDGSQGAQARKVMRFVRRLRRAVGDLPVLIWDERFSTQDATDRLRAAGRGTGEGRVDAHAAAVILQSFLDAGGQVTPVKRSGRRRRRAAN